MRTFLVYMMLAGLLSACSNGAMVHSVAFYKKHEQARKTIIRKCNNNPGQDILKANCANAKKAAYQAALNADGHTPHYKVNFNKSPTNKDKQ